MAELEKPVNLAMDEETEGGRRVIASFNPSRSRNIDMIKALAAITIDYVNKLEGKDVDLERLKETAKTQIEGAAMWAVKAAAKARDD